MDILNGLITSASVQVRNDGDEQKKYDIVANVTVNTVDDEFGGNNGTGRIQGGNVSLDGTTVATFANYSNLSIQYNVSDVEEQAEILSAVQEFCSAAVSFANGATMSASVETEE